jgi:hypothetical protein
LPSAPNRTLWVTPLRGDRSPAAFSALAARAVVSYDNPMCIICADFDRGVLKLDEARRALREMAATLDAAHAREVVEKLDEAEEAERA